MSNFNYPFVPNTESFVGQTNREMVEGEEASEASEGMAAELAEKDESGPLPLPGNPEPAGTRY